MEKIMNIKEYCGAVCDDEIKMKHGKEENLSEGIDSKNISNIHSKVS